MSNRQLKASIALLLLLLIGCFFWGKSSEQKTSKALMAEKDDEILQLKSDIQNLRFNPPHNNIQQYPQG